MSILIIMDWIILMWILGLILSISLAYLGYITYKKEKQTTYPDYSNIVIAIIVIIVIVICCFLINLCIYSCAVDLPYKYRSSIMNIEEMEEYLMKYEALSNESFGNIGQGLESLEYKQQIQDAIREKNKLYAEICGWLNNFWSPYKDVIISGLPPGEYT